MPNVNNNTTYSKRTKRNLTNFVTSNLVIIFSFDVR
jgi:hypothetical protein